MLIVSVTANLLFLATFKYLGFFVTEFAELLERLGFNANMPVLEIVLPVGISFYTFQTIGYVVDVYRGKVPAERNSSIYALYVAFFPQLVAGPIERAAHMIPQFRNDRVWSTPAFESGLQLAVWGLFKKIVIADNLAPYVDAVYADPTEFSGAALITATVFFAFQIYCDFSGYTDTARGVRAHARLRAHAELRLSVHLEDAGRVLAALAHQPVAVVPGLSVLPARDAVHAPRRMGEQVQGAHRRDGADRSLARRELDVSRLRPLLGRRDCAVSRDGRTGVECTSPAALPIDYPGPRRTLREYRLRSADVRARLHRLGVLPRRLDR